MVGEGFAIAEHSFLTFLRICISYITNIKTKENPYPIDGKTSSVKDDLYVGFYKTLRL